MDGWTAWWTDGRTDGWMDVIHLDTESTLVLVKRYICREKKVFNFFFILHSVSMKSKILFSRSSYF